MKTAARTAVLLFACLAMPVTLVGAGTHEAAAAAPVTAAQIAARVQGFYDRTRTYQARFEQVYVVSAYRTKKQSTGTVVFQRPGKMSWLYDEPSGNRVVSDGTLLRVYERENKQMVEQPLGTSQYPAVLSFLIGKGDLRDTFHLRLLDARKLGFEGGYVLEGTPKTPNAAYNKVLMYVDGATAQVRRMIVIDAQRNRNTFTFSSPSVNLALAAGTFRFNPPPGTQILRN